MSNPVEGKLEISKGVLADLVGYATLECYGVVGVASASIQDTFLRAIPVTRLRRGVKISTSDNGIEIDVYVVVEYGVNISLVSENLAEKINFIINEYTGITPAAVRIHVSGVNTK